MPKRKREDDDDYVDFCSGLQSTSRDGVGDTSYIYSNSRPFKRPRINPNFYQPARVQYRYVDRHEAPYKEIKQLITNDSIVIDEIIEVKNHVLQSAYNSKKQQKQKEYKGHVTEALLFHGTKETNLNSICKFNFDWRLTGSNKGHKFGKGVCFSPNAKYASSYSDKMTYYKVMVVAKVLIGKVCPGNHDMSIPPQGYDTSQKGDDGIVLVKYEDNEFYPAYIMHYHFEERRHFNYRVNIRCNYCNRCYCNCLYSSYESGYDSYTNRYRDYDNHYNFYNSQNYSDYQSSEYSSDGNYCDSNNYYSFN